MKTLIHRYATPLTTGFFLVSTISGVALFFHWSSGLFHSMHEWLSMVLLVPIALHLWKNWGPLMGYIKRKTLFIPLVLSLVVALPFVVANFSTRSAGNPAVAVVQLVAKAPLSDSAALFKATPDELVARMRQHGWAVESTSASLNQVAQAAHMPPVQMIAALLRDRP